MALVSLQVRWCTTAFPELENCNSRYPAPSARKSLPVEQRLSSSLASMSLKCPSEVQVFSVVEGCSQFACEDNSNARRCQDQWTHRRIHVSLLSYSSLCKTVKPDTLNDGTSNWFDIHLCRSESVTSDHSSSIEMMLAAFVGWRFKSSNNYCRWCALVARKTRST